jgi:hypothetical protein
MKVSALSVTFASGLLWTLAAGAAIPTYFQKDGFTRRDLDSAKVQRELGSQLSKKAVIYGPTDSRYAAATSRWTDWERPKIEAVVEPGTEDDVAKIVRPVATTLIWGFC